MFIQPISVVLLLGRESVPGILAIEEARAAARVRLVARLSATTALAQVTFVGPPAVRAGPQLFFP